MPKIRSNVALKKLNTFAVSATASHFIQLNSCHELLNVIPQISLYPNRLVLGGGSNILFVGDFEGLILYPQIFGINIIHQDENEIRISVGASHNWHQLVIETLKNNWYGLENLALIPGTVGAAPVQNIGAYGVEVERYIHRVECVDLDSGELHLLAHDECQFGYRESFFKKAPKGKFLITRVEFNLNKKPQLCLTYPPLAEHFSGQVNILPQAVMQRVCQVRQEKLPDPKKLANAGSFFKNPVVQQKVFEKLKLNYPDIVAFPVEKGMKLAAGWLIEKAGFKGVREGDVGVHANQALVLVNYAETQGIKLWQLAEKIQKKILQVFNVQLEVEVRVIGLSDL
ncbi:UDP-N-acetylmuramate dehydrogenase [Aliikangiella sp. IMCC44359]|uniref:UDP-N-acetylmuramate dehydrogenase n=1 Tax=Aliikangiella sp. IMCC44359 TaxID=3459125 RepID=UPI00403A980A